MAVLKYGYNNYTRKGKKLQYEHWKFNKKGVIKKEKPPVRVAWKLKNIFPIKYKIIIRVEVSRYIKIRAKFFNLK